VHSGGYIALIKVENKDNYFYIYVLKLKMKNILQYKGENNFNAFYQLMNKYICSWIAWQSTVYTWNEYICIMYICIHC